jgi:hypothetical protein
VCFSLITKRTGRRMPSESQAALKLVVLVREVPTPVMEPHADTLADKLDACLAEAQVTFITSHTVFAPT